MGSYKWSHTLPKRVIRGSGFIRTCVVGLSTGNEASDRVQGLGLLQVGL